jgi:6-phosphogluconolactonase
MTTLSLSPSAAVQIIPFDSLSQLAVQSSPLLGGGTIALSGGSTYAQLFELWAALKPRWESTVFFPVDERMVPFESEQSNWGTAWRTFLQAVGRGEDKMHWPTSANQYEQLLRAHFAPAEVVLDTVFLGVGDDGHTASLFPASPALDDYASLVLETISPKAPSARITLGAGTIANAHKVITIVAGIAKAPLIPRIFAADNTLPIIQVLSRCTHSVMYIERALLD